MKQLTGIKLLRLTKGLVIFSAILLFLAWGLSISAVVVGESQESTLMERLNLLELKMEALERNYEMCCTSQYKAYGVSADLEEVVTRRRELRKLRNRMSEMEEQALRRAEESERAQRELRRIEWRKRYPQER